MDKEAIKINLSGFRAGSAEDAGDPHFAEALRAVRDDPELSAWFAEEQRFDAIMSEKLAQAEAPAGLKDAIVRRVLKSPELPSQRIRRISFAPWLAAAAAVTAAFFLGRVTVPTPLAPDSAGGSLALQAISYTGRMPALQFVCFDANAVRSWVDQKSAAMQMGRLIDKQMTSMQMIGSSATRWEGKPVIMVALQNGGRMAMLYLMRASDFPQAAKEAGSVMERDGWASKTGRRGDRLFILTTRGTERDLDFPMPL